MAEQMPQRLGRYQVLRELGRGAMGVVYEGRDPDSGLRVALKTVRRERLAEAEAREILQRFKREAEAAARLTHPNIVAVYEYGEDAGVVFIAMEYADGRELKASLDGAEPFPLAPIQNVMAGVLAALGHAHAHGVVHRDIKPANIFLLQDDRVKVGDFGIARVESSNLTQVGAVLGSPSYMSPEQFMGRPVDGRSDLFSAGVLLYQLLTGSRPFTGHLGAIMQQVLKEDPLPPSRCRQGVPPAFDAVVAKALAKQPEARFQNAEQFAAALAAACGLASTDHRESPAGTVTSKGADAEAPSAAPARPVPAPEAGRSGARGDRRFDARPYLILVGVLLALMLVARWLLG